MIDKLIAFSYEEITPGISRSLIKYDLLSFNTRHTHNRLVEFVR